MKVLILSCNTGQGHNSVANAIGETLENRGHQWELTDALAFLSERTSRFISWGHSFLYCHCPGIFAAGYDAAEKHPNTLSEGSMSFRFFARGAKDLYEYCKDENFDAIICTHVFAAIMLTVAMRNHDLKVHSYFVATDYTGYPGVQDSHVGTYFIPDDSLAGDFADKVTFASGIPVYQKFYKEIDRADAKAELGLDGEKTHILMMCGSMGCGPIEEIARQISQNMGESCCLSIICGTNQRLYQRLSDTYQDNDLVQVHGFVQNIPTMMASADIYVTKPGGISTTEAMAKGLPMVLVDAVAGCEDYNMHYFQDIGGAVADKNPKRIAQMCLELVADADRRQEMSQRLLEHRKNGAVAICDYIQEHSCQPVD